MVFDLNREHISKMFAAIDVKLTECLSGVGFCARFDGRF